MVARSPATSFVSLGDKLASSEVRIEQRRSLGPLLLSRALDHHARVSFERSERGAEIGPVLQLLDTDVILRITAGASGKQCARYVDHLGRPLANIHQRRAAAFAEAARVAS